MTRRLLLFVAVLLAAVSARAGTWRSITPDGGSIYALAAAPEAGKVVYAHSGRGTFLRSLDGALSWHSRGPKLGLLIHELTVDPGDSAVVYARTLSGLFKTADGGESWSLLLEGAVWAFSISPSNWNVFYAAREKEVLRSDDAGASWTVVRQNQWITQYLAVDSADWRIVYAEGTDGFFRSQDGGGTWTEIEIDSEHGGITALAADPRKPSTLYASQWPGRILKSSDRGATWSLLWEVPGSFPVIQAIQLDRVNGWIYVLSNTYGIFLSTDDGASWSHVFPGYNVAFAFQPGTPQLYVGTREGGVRASENGGRSWRFANHGIRELSFSRVAADPNIPDLVFAVGDPEGIPYLGLGRQILFKSTDGGRSWTFPFGSPEESPNVNDLAADPSRPGTWYLAGGGRVWKTADGGATWEHANRGLRFPEFVATLALAASDGDRLYAIGWDTFPICGSPSCPELRMFRSRDAAASWQPSRVPGLKHLELLGSLAVDAVDPSTVYAAGAGLFRTTDGGKTWKKLGGGQRNGIAYVAADPFQSGTLYGIVQVKESWRLFKSTDHGATWSNASKGVPARASMGRLAADPTAPDTLYVGTTLGVYVTRNGGKLWTAMNEGLGSLPVFSVAVDPLQPDVLYVARDDGIFRFSEE